MKKQKYLVFAMMPLFAATAVADDEEESEMKIVVAGAVAGDHNAIHWTGDSLQGLDMHGMQVGESRSIIDDAGRAILVTREEDGFRFDVDGKSVSVPAPAIPGEYLALAEAQDATAVYDVEIVGDCAAMPIHRTNTVTIVTDEPLDATTQESIRAVLQSAGRNDTVNFIDGANGVAGSRQIKVIRKQIEVEH